MDETTRHALGALAVIAVVAVLGALISSANPDVGGPVLGIAVILGLVMLARLGLHLMRTPSED